MRNYFWSENLKTKNSETQTQLDNFKIKEAITSVKPVTFDIDEIGMFPKETVTLTGEDKEIFSKFLNMVDEMEDVKTVYHNVNL